MFGENPFLSPAQTWLRTLTSLSTLVAAGVILAPLFAEEATTQAPAIVNIDAGDGFQERLQGRLITAAPGEVIILPVGRFKLDKELNVAASSVTIRGQGPDQTILQFAGQRTGSHGLLATGDNLVLEDFAIEDAAGTALKTLGCRNVIFRRLRAEWTGGEKPTNGAYGLYPVQCDNVLIEACTAIGASDAGIYVGQSRQVVVRRCRAERNVAGIEIENTIDADVYENVATNNTAGLLVFDLPGLPQRNGKRVRVFNNQVTKNNHVNFAPQGNLVATLPPGTGMMVMATDDVELFQNEISANKTCNLAVLSYETAGTRHSDANFDPTPERISIHDNRFSSGGDQPQGILAQQLASFFSDQFPDILYDGVRPPNYDEKKQGPLIYLENNGEATFADIQIGQLTPQNLLSGKYQIIRNTDAYQKPIAALSEVKLTPHAPAQGTVSAAVAVYRSAPKRLSEWGLFVGDGSSQQPVDGVIPYDLNTPLFSDYASKYRFIRLPKAASIDWRDDDVLDFPVGTVIAKTFAYPTDMRDLDAGQTLLETRIQIRKETGWYGFAYIWNDEQNEAMLSLGGGEINASWIHTNGARRTNQYRVPNANECLNCHRNDREFTPLGPTARNLNREFAYPHGGENQLSHWSARGWLSNAPPEARRPRLADFQDPTGDIDRRARAYLEVNCAHCHNPTGTASTSGLDLRSAQTDPFQYGVWKPPVAAGQGAGDRKYDIVPGHPEASILMRRLESSQSAIQMPPIAHEIVHDEGVRIIRQWIEQHPTVEPTDHGKN
ncbi:right-handed parallel beta-helix repeat-containing protein [Blastopirellula sp. J2-11]|uniref:parallel beta-helix domain-containing protein n=1 Tax=Blastopirellula sp. J2-11 TaxID=2943192 RepID=UPI0021C98410|nr:parallel beta-helix domain-containing protein [Blastopirellula sp. J2-11]UUO07771.1 right-handed parallel beta-helix repeat-containing protein [Blastopirellula sp. J2-11]